MKKQIKLSSEEKRMMFAAISFRIESLEENKDDDFFETKDIKKWIKLWKKIDHAFFNEQL